MIELAVVSVLKQNLELKPSLPLVLLHRPEMNPHWVGVGPLTREAVYFGRDVLNA